MKTIYKYKLEHVSSQDLQLPEGAQILDIQLQDNYITLWALVNLPVTSTTKRTLQIFGTGLIFDIPNLNYLKTIQQSGFVWHIFEQTNAS